MKVRPITIMKALAAVAATTAAVTVPAGIASADTPPTAAQIASAARASVPAPAVHAGIWGSYILNGKRVPIWLGSYTVWENGKPVTVICVSPDDQLRTPTHFRVGDYGTKQTSARLNYIMFSWGAGSSGTVTAGAKLAMFAELGIKLPGLEMRNPEDTAPVMTYVRNDRANAARYSGFSGASMAFGGKLTTPGQKKKTGVKMVINSATKPSHQIPGVPDRLTAGSASVAAYGRSGEWSALTRTSAAPVWVKGTATIASGEDGIGTAGAGAQTLISAVPLNVSAESGYQAHPAPVRTAVACNCDGTGNVTGSVTQAAGSDEGSYTLYVNGRARATVTVPAGKQAAELKAADVADGSLVTFTVRYKAGGRWTAPAALGGTFTVICPAAPSITASCGCDVTLTLASPLAASSGLAEDLVYSVAGGKPVTVAIPAGGARSATFAVPSGASVTYRAQVLRGTAVVSATAPATWS